MNRATGNLPKKSLCQILQFWFTGADLGHVKDHTGINDVWMEDLQKEKNGSQVFTKDDNETVRDKPS